MNILLLNLPNAPYTEKSLLIEPIDILNLSTYLNELDYNIKFLDMDCKKLDYNYLKNYIEQTFMPDVVVIPYDYHIPLHTHEVLEELPMVCKMLKKLGITSVMIGKTVTYNPKIIEKISFDIGVIGEVEYVIKNLLEIDFKNKEKLSKISGIVFKNDKDVIITKSNDKKIELNNLPTITRRDFVELNDYIDVRSILTSRGCINNCKFCPSQKYWGNWRAKSAVLVVEEIKYLVQAYNTKKIILLDDNATVDNERMQQISLLLIKQNINVKLGCLASINTYDKNTFELMYKAGFRWVHFGIESGSQSVLKNNNKEFDIIYAKQVIREVKQMGYRVRTSFIFDMPTTLKDDMGKTIEFILETQPDEIRAHFLSLRLGTQLYENLTEYNKMHSQYIHSEKPLLENTGYKNSELLKDINNLIIKLKEKNYKIVRDCKDWNNLENLRNKDGGIKFLSFCPSKYGIDWE